MIGDTMKEKIVGRPDYFDNGQPTFKQLRLTQNKVLNDEINTVTT
jgi:hypothetical protein